MTEQLMLELYQAFEESKEQFIKAGVRPIAFIDRYRGQPLNPEQYEYFDMPAIFIGRSMQWERAGNCYNGIMSLDFHLVTEPMGEASNIAIGKEQALKYYQLVNQVRAVLDHFSSERISEMQRSNDREMDTGVIIYEVLSYTCIYYEDGPKGATAQPEKMEIIDSHLVKVLKRR
jgi:hypothetical protein